MLVKNTMVFPMQYLSGKGFSVILPRRIASQLGAEVLRWPCIVAFRLCSMYAVTFANA